MSTTATPKHTNLLSREKSPYLLQHQHNPVNWRAWNAESFALAQHQDKPIFLSIGYSTCHWCHVMERESFENPEAAQVLNEHYISIKVDREERPDVDKIYMNFVMAQSGQGGWPLNVFLTPDLKPFYGGTYFPPEPRHGRPAFAALLRQIAVLWKSKRLELNASANQTADRLKELATQLEPAEQIPGAEALANAAATLKSMYEPRHGGFGNAPKFPQPAHPRFLLQYGIQNGDEEAVRMVLHTCERMAAGGIHDQLGGGFARYSVDAEWLVPHFEKMLYDNAQLAQLYLDAYAVTGQPAHATVVRRILDYILRDMTHPDGGFFSAEDADSEGQEGKFYCWTRQELASLLSPEEFQVASRYYGVTSEGNFIDHSHPQPLAGLNVLSVVDERLSETEKDLLATANNKMIAARSQRVRPHLDDKILVSWNGLMLGAMARAGIVLNEERYLQAASRNAAFLKAKLWNAEARVLYHRWRDGERDQVELLEGTAFLLSGMLDLYEATIIPEHLEFAVALAESMLNRFFDHEHGGFWQSAPGAEDLILRLKGDYDGAEPSGNSIAVLSLLKLAKITGREDFQRAAEATLRLFSQRLATVPQAVPCMLQALAFSLEEPRRATLAGDAQDPATRNLLQAVHSVFQPNKVVLGTTGHVEAFARTLPTSSPPQMFICTGSACQPPSNEPAVIRELMATHVKIAGR